MALDVRSIEDVAPIVEHNGTVPVWWMIKSREFKDITDGGFLELVNEFEEIKSKIASLGGAVTKVEPWGLKSLAFRIKKNRKAHFTLLNIAGPSEAVVEVERLLSINEDVIRYLTIRVDEHEAGPSAMLRKREDGDRDDRGPRGPRGDRPDRCDRGDRGDRSDRGDRPPRRPRDDANLGVS